MEWISKYSHIREFFSAVLTVYIVGSNNEILQPKAGKVGQKSSLDWEIVQKEVPVPYQNSFQVAEVVPTNLVCMVAQMESPSGLWCVVPEGPNCYEIARNVLYHCSLPFRLYCMEAVVNSRYYPLVPSLVLLSVSVGVSGICAIFFHILPTQVFAPQEEDIFEVCYLLFTPVYLCYIKKKLLYIFKM